ncbi:putative restriction endonuclease [Campylobacter pinnipediorum subsp. caledonicus]|uniref:Putative restriction endonuclease n=1 Tax=Campylobacter pinnipediorum subsp. caledonicus TaxID=1874362 RepID=A0A1S6U735_9BACT|nr:restriction endonuclease [Campylobacter pinnipediorum]AQW85874.1 putative restriction endonuclease [Campylobacter pinnipediorum subsp. caledonicus]AQW87482.1 putative restriction endonuclease [Campylobacter pinnipediorum subsp. caledonicus]
MKSLITKLKSFFDTKEETKKDEIIEQVKKIREEKELNEFKEEENQKPKENRYQKGRKYELYIKNFFEKKEYKVYPKGYIEKRKDSGIDLIAYKNNEMALIQCKNWTNPPKQKELKVFVINCDLYINQNKDKIKDKTIRKLFITSNSKQDYGVKCFLEEYNKQNDIKIEYIIINMED